MEKKLPEECYALTPSDGKVIYIYNGEMGYYETDYTTSDSEANQKIVDQLNNDLKVTKEEVVQMMRCSMFGW